MMQKLKEIHWQFASWQKLRTVEYAKPYDTIMPVKIIEAGIEYFVYKFSDKSIEWYINIAKIGHKLILSRQYGPALYGPLNDKSGNRYFKWYKDGKLHRESGPAFKGEFGEKEYYLNNRHYPDIKNDKEWLEFQEKDLIIRDIIE